MQTAMTGHIDQGRRERIEVLVTHGQKELLEQAAARRGLPLADYVSEVLERVVTEETGTDVGIGANVIIPLSPEDSAIVAAAFLNPPDPAPALREAVRRYGRRAGLVADTVTATADGELGV